jgi:hypothetical protein
MGYSATVEAEVSGFRPERLNEVEAALYRVLDMDGELAAPITRVVDGKLSLVIRTVEATIFGAPYRWRDQMRPKLAAAIATANGAPCTCRLDIQYDDEEDL